MKLLAAVPAADLIVVTRVAPANARYSDGPWNTSTVLELVRS